MHPQLESIAGEFRSALDRFDRLAAAVPADAWDRRADPDRWSVAECIGHLNLTAEAFRPRVVAGLEEARRLGGAAPARYRRDPAGWLLWRVMAPPPLFRVKTSAPFVPEAGEAKDAMAAHFRALQQEQLEWVVQGDGLPLERVRVPSPFAGRVRYNVFSCLSILPRHQHRHLWQAEQVVAALGRTP